ncbi:MAG TPA: urease accessory protein UreE [Methylomirabilota bacterium]|jgi:urease accessory protein|nr:urease accessory protein UreE [Methylomirabilota bacterium]
MLIAGVPVVTQTLGALEDSELRGRARDVVVMSAEERRWGRRRIVTRAGRELALALPTGVGVAVGEVLHVDAEWYVVVEAAAEPVLLVRPESWVEAVRLAFEVGNRHGALAVNGEWLLLPDEAAMEQLLARLGMAFERARAPFAPVGFGHRHD